jgi:hypothetical protein
MQAALMKRPARVAVIAATLLALGAALAFALLSGSTHTAQAAVHHSAKHAAKKHAAHFISTKHVSHKAATRTADPAGPSDGDTVQSGDQSTPDTPGETSTETSGEAPSNEPDTGPDVQQQGDFQGNF